VPQLQLQLQLVARKDVLFMFTCTAHRDPYMKVKCRTHPGPFVKLNFHYSVTTRNDLSRTFRNRNILSATYRRQARGQVTEKSL